MVVMLEAIGRECLAIALSPYHSYDLGKTYVVHFGANGNLQTVLRRHVNFNEAVDVSFPSRVCGENNWVPYWIVLQGGKLSAGVGKVPGKNCIGTLDDTMYNMLRSGVDAVRYVGIGNSALQRSARDLRVRNVMVSSIPEHFGLGGIPLEECGFVNILEMGYGSGSGGNSMEEGGGGAVPTEAELLAEYEKERAKAKARAAKFGVEYKEPAPDAFMKWSEARRLRMNPEKGFITGIDTFSMEEKAKADARKERFAKDERKRKGLDSDEEEIKGEDGEEDMDDDGVDDVAEWEKTKRDPLAIEQAWDNWELVEQFRSDPTDSVVKKECEGGTMATDDAMDKSDEVEQKEDFIPKSVTVVPTKIHIFSMDHQCFKQIRTDDLMSYFKDYGPSYVEWLGELSCNVMFEDRHSAARAFHALSQELPTPPPKDLIDARIKERNERNGPKKLDWVPPTKVEADGDEVVDNPADDAEAAAADETGDGMVADGDEAIKEETSKDQEEERALPDYGGMGWRFCKWTVRKVSNDRYGVRGTRARVLMRLATSLDVLDDRPTEWPKPPPGFTTKRKLMPWYDFSDNRRRRSSGGRDAKRRRSGGRDRRRSRSRGYDDSDDRYDNRYDDDGGDISEDNYEGGEHPMLSEGLRSGR
ncbi:predicted protein [Thalassiosira pseudonana CCMP1335]|uniref:Uncharacterized protein n=1 Tax=Thalassiosira pseudonana TaxID=35128 RepID=B8CCJ0_THAPS|nr:predicted protein [Thalassiosira pseudonana CCMP1335]EED88959.1 predicted protein [Thalassiosira pseudonana CCMP1335]